MVITILVGDDDNDGAGEREREREMIMMIMMIMILIISIITITLFRKILVGFHFAQTCLSGLNTFSCFHNLVHFIDVDNFLFFGSR